METYDLSKLKTSLLLVYQREFCQEELPFLGVLNDTFVESYDKIQKPVNTCAQCGKEASKMCSRCKSIWFCSKDCQVINYKNSHNKYCKKIAKEKGLYKEEDIKMVQTKLLKQQETQNSLKK